MKTLLVYLKDYKKESVLGPLFKLLEASFELFIPLVIAAMVDKGIATQDMPYIWKMGGILILLAFIGLTCAVTAQFFAARAATGFATKARHALFEKLQSLSFAELDTLGTSTMITRMTSDLNQVQGAVNMVLRLFLRSPFIVFGAMVMAFSIDVKAALVFVVTIPLLSIVVFGVMLISIPLYEKVQAALDRVLGKTRENLTGVRVIRAFNKEEQECLEFGEANSALTALQLFVGRILAFMNPLTYVIINGALICLIWTGALQVNIGILTQGQVIALVNYMSQILVELVKLASLIIQLTKALACADRVADIMKMESTMDAGRGEHAGDDSVKFDHVSFMYKGSGAETLTDISFEAKAGETIGVIGGTGSGKSTLISLIARFYDVTKGSVLVGGKDVRELSLDELRTLTGVVMQKSILFKGTIRDNMRFGCPDATDDDIMEALRIAQAEEFVVQKEGVLDFEISQGGKNLSGGQRQRLNIARALVRKPQILILDDSSSALDYATDAALRKAIREMSGKMTTFIVSQRTASILHADRILVLEDGELVGCGTHSELLNSCNVYREIYDSQFNRGEE